MTNLVETPQWEDGIYQLETEDPVLGGPDGIDNLQAKQLGNRTSWLKAQIDALAGGAAGMATEAYVKNAINMLDYKQSVRAATTGNISLSGVQTVDGISLLVGQRILVKDQVVASQNGIYLVSGGGWSRVVDADVDSEITPGLTVYVEEGAKQGKSRWQVVTTGAISLGTTSIAFALVPGALQANSLRSVALSAATVNLTADDAGSVISITGSGGGTLVLPAAASVMAGEMISIRCDNTSVSTNTVKGVAGDTLGGAVGRNLNSAVVEANDAFLLVSDGVSKWNVVVENTGAFVASQFANLFSANGYCKLPGGAILQWGNNTPTNSSGIINFSFPVTFPSACRCAIAQVTAGSAPLAAIAVTSTPSRSGMTVYVANGSSGGVPGMGVTWFAIGY